MATMMDIDERLERRIEVDLEDDEEEEAERGHEDGDDQEMDSDEEELERQLFGDATFGKNIQELSKRARNQVGLIEADEGEDLKTLQLKDDDLFFIDAEPEAEALQKLDGDSGSDEDETYGEAAWKDSDDERVMVSLAGTDRLRKLRETEEEDVMDGREYSRRMRRQ
jgi:U3 small nucleolar RNA-associated protein 18